MKPYEIEWIPDLGHDCAKVELPFCVRQGHESPAEFASRAERDFGIIKRFTVKFAVSKHGCEELAADMVVMQLQLHVTKTAAFARAFLNNVQQKVAEPVLDVLYEECIGNLPVQFKDGGLDPNSDKMVVKQAQLPFNSVGAVATVKADTSKPKTYPNSKPLVVAVPNPKNFTTN